MTESTNVCQVRRIAAVRDVRRQVVEMQVAAAAAIVLSMAVMAAAATPVAGSIASAQCWLGPLAGSFAVSESVLTCTPL
jgi:hypothetical protein